MKNILLILVTSYLFIVLAMYLLQRHLLYFPTSVPGKLNHEVITIESDDLKVKVVVSNTHYDKAVIYFGGNGENVYNSVSAMEDAFTDHAVYFVNYPGYGGSSGTPSEVTINQAANDVYAYVSKKHQSVALVGRSLGTGVAFNLASKHRVSHLILISPYDSIASVANTHYPFLPNSWLIKDRFDSESRADNVSGHILILIAEQDNVIPIKHSMKLKSAIEQNRNAQASKLRLESRLYKLSDHNNVHLHPEFMQDIRRFLQH